MRRLLHDAAHLAVWAGMYIGAATVCFAQVAGIDSRAEEGDRWLRAIAYSFCIAAAVYLLDRVKLRDAWLDPADAAAHPARYGFLAARTGVVRALMVGLLACAVWIGLPLAGGSILLSAALPAMAVVGVLVYAARPRKQRDRPKDVLMLKNAYVAAGITAFGGIVALVAAAPIGADNGARDLIALCKSHVVVILISAGHLFVRVLADAVLCDLDDLAADAKHGTRTLPGRLGRGNSWNLAMGARVVVGLMLAGIALTVKGVPAAAMMCWAGVTVVSSVVLRVAAPAKVRDWVDARFAIEAGAVSLVLWFLR